MDFVDSLNAERSECAEANVERDARYFDSFGRELFKSSRREVQACGGRGNGTAFAGKDRLIAVAIGTGVLAMDIRRKRGVADPVEHGEEVICRALDWSELEQTLAELATLEDFGFKRDGAVRSGEDEALADGNFAAGANEGAPAILADRVKSGFKEHDFDAACRLLSIPDQCAVRVETRRNHAAVVEDEQIARAKMLTKARERIVAECARRAVHDEHAAGAALGWRLLRDQLFG